MADKPKVTKTETMELRAALRKRVKEERLTLGEIFAATGVKPAQLSPLIKHGIPVGKEKTEKLWAFLLQNGKPEMAKT